MASSLFAAALLVTGAFAQQSQWGQCGGVGWSGPTTCTSGNTCTKQNDYYYQCIPGGSGGSPTTSSQPPTQTGGNGGGNTGKTQYFGVNIAGFDFGCATNGNCDTKKIYPPVKDFNGANNYPDGIGQMKHFHDDLGMNFFRLPVGWQYLVNNNLGGNLDSNNLAQYDKLVQGCRSISGAQCIIDIHNYARWNGGIIGQGGPTDDQFVSLWRQLATKYASQTNVWFGIMNEPHDVNIQTWGQTVQKVVTAIRQAGATNNYITLPGNGWQSAGTFISDGSAAALSQVKNPDGTTNKLIIDVHKYLDSDNSGTTTTCVTNNIDNAFAPLANWLRQNGRKAILTESGGGNTDSCLKYFCEQIKYLNQNSDVYLGYTGWSAGSFDSTYELVLTPTWNGNGWTDRALTKCLLQ